MKVEGSDILGSTALMGLMKVAPLLNPKHTHTHAHGVQLSFLILPKGVRNKKGQPKKLTDCSLRLAKNATEKIK